MEYWDIFDEFRRPKNKTHLRGIPLEDGDYHLVVEIWAIGHDGLILLSQRHPDKPYPLKWECTGGSVLKGESSLDGAVREIGEEVGIHVSPEQLIPVRSYRRTNCHDFLDVYLLFTDISLDELTFQDTEVVGAKRVGIEALRKIENSGELVPGLGYIYDLYDNYVTGVDW